MKRSHWVFAILCLFGAVVLSDSGGPDPYGNLVIERIPPTPVALRAQARPYDVRGAVLLDWHPARLEMLVRTLYDRAGHIQEVRRPGGARYRITRFTDSVSGVSYHPNGGDYFVFNMDHNGSERFQKYRYDLRTDQITLLTDGRSRNSPGVWSKSGDRLAYLSDRRNDKDQDLYVMNPLRPASDRLLTRLGGDGWAVEDWAPGDRAILLQGYRSINETYLWLFDLASGKRTLLTPKRSSEMIYYGHARFSPGGKGIYLITDRDFEFRRLAYLDLASRQYIYLTSRIPWDVTALDLSQDGRMIAFVSNEDGFGKLHVLDTTTREEKPTPWFPPGVISGVKWHPDGRHLGFNFEAARFSPDVFSLDLKTGQGERWTDSTIRTMRSSEFSEPELIHWRSFDGRRLSGYLYRPPARFKGARPVIIDIHGGPESQARPGYLAAYNFWLNELGVALLFPNVRGSSGYGKTFLKLDNGFHRVDAYRDIGALLDWVRRRPELDATRVMVQGASYGGNMALAVAAMYNDRIRCVIDIAGPSDFVTMLEGRKTEQDQRRAEYGDERDPRMRAFLERIAPLNNARKITKPLFIVQGANDPRVPLREAEQMRAAVKKNGTPVWYMMAQDEGHSIQQPGSQSRLWYALALFTERYLLNEPRAPVEGKVPLRRISR